MRGEAERPGENQFTIHSLAGSYKKSIHPFIEQIFIEYLGYVSYNCSRHLGYTYEPNR